MKKSPTDRRKELINKNIYAGKKSPSLTNDKLVRDLWSGHWDNYFPGIYCPWFDNKYKEKYFIDRLSKTNLDRSKFISWVFSNWTYIKNQLKSSIHVDYPLPDVISHNYNAILVLYTASLKQSVDEVQLISLEAKPLYDVYIRRMSHNEAVKKANETFRKVRNEHGQPGSD